MSLLAAALAVLALASPPAVLPLGADPIAGASRYVESRQTGGGGFAEPGSAPTPGLTAWAVIGLRAAGRSPAALEGARAYLERSEAALESATDIELVLVARAALGERPPALVARLRALERPDGGIGPTVNSTIWGVLALRAVGERPSPASVRYLLGRQRRSGGWSWSDGATPDSNDTAAAIQALRVAGVGGAPIGRGLAYLRRHQNRDGGFELGKGRGSDVQSTAWALQAFAAAGTRAPASRRRARSPQPQRERRPSRSRARLRARRDTHASWRPARRPPISSRAQPTQSAPDRPRRRARRSRRSRPAGSGGT